MSRLTEVLGVQEGQSFRFEGWKSIYKIENGKRWYLMSNNRWDNCAAEVDLAEMINHPELIHPLPQYTEQQLTAFRGRIAEGTPWVARDDYRRVSETEKSSEVFFFKEKPRLLNYTFEGEYCECINADTPLYDFVTFENSPIDLREIVKEAEGV